MLLWLVDYLYLIITGFVCLQFKVIYLVLRTVLDIIKRAALYCIVSRDTTTFTTFKAPWTVLSQLVQMKLAVVVSLIEIALFLFARYWFRHLA